MHLRITNSDQQKKIKDLRKLVKSLYTEQHNRPK